MRHRRAARAQGPQGGRPFGRDVDARCHRPSRARRRGASPHGAHRARRPAAEHHRPRGRPPADRQRGRHGRRGLQRGDLQLPRASRTAAAFRARPAHERRHRGARAPLRGAGRGPRRRARRHVRVLDLGRAAPEAAARPRPARDQAAVRRPRRRAPRVRLGDQVAAPPPRRQRAARSRRDRRLPPAQVRPGAAHHVRRDRGAAARAPARVRRTRRPDAAVVGPVVQARRRAPGRARRDRRAPRSPARGGAQPPRQRRAVRRLPQRRHRQQHGRRADDSGAEPTPSGRSSPGSRVRARISASCRTRGWSPSATRRSTRR